MDSFLQMVVLLICGEHFSKDDYLFTNSKKLKDGAIPSVFNFPSHLHNNSLRRKQPSKRVCVPPNRKLTLEEKKTEAPASSSPTKEDLQAKLKQQESKIKVLKQKLRRKYKRISTFKDIISQLKGKQLIKEQLAVQLQDEFSGLSLVVIKNHFK